MRRHLLRALVAAGLLLASSSGAWAAPSPTPTPTATPGPTASPATARRTLPGHTLPKLAGVTPVGQTDPTRELQLSIGLQPSNAPQLANLLQQQRDPRS